MSNEQLDRHPMELTTQEGKNLIDQIDDLKPVSADSVRNQPFAQVYRESPLSFGHFIIRRCAKVNATRASSNRFAVAPAPAPMR